MRLVLSLVLSLAACAHASRPPESSPPPPTSAAAADPVIAPKPAIARVWHGRVPNARADEYATYLASALPKFRQIAGNLGYEMYRETAGPETHFMVVSYWTSRDAIHAYAGADISRTRPLPRDAEFLIDPEPTVRNYDVVAQDLAR
jgi:heme-degrading monooxygenase HmoA